MRKLFSRSLGVLLSAAMILTSISTPVFAEEIPEGEVEIVQETADDFDLVENEEVSIDEESTVVYEEEIGDVEETEIIEEESEEELIVVESDSEETEEIEEDMDLLVDPEPSSPAVIFTLNGEKADLANFLNFTDEAVIGADGTILTPGVAITFKIVDGAVPEGKRFVKIQYNGTDFAEPVEDVYIIPAESNAGENITVNMITNDILTGVTLEGVSKNAVSLEAGASKTYTIKRKEAASTDKLEAKPNDDAEGFSVTINEEQTELTVQINETDAANVQGDFVIINKDDENKEIAKFSVSATNPVWTSKTVTASVQLSTDVDIRLTIKPFTTLGSKLYDGNYYYEVKLITPEGLDSTRRMNPAVRYVEPLLDGNTVYFNLQENTATDPEHPNWVDAEPGEGGSATFNVEVKLVQKKSSVATPTKEDDYFLSTKATKFDASLKVPHYAEKITVKKNKTALLAGECDVKIGTVTFGKNDTYVNNDDWVIQSVTAPNGNTFGTVFEPYSGNIRSVYGVTVYKSTSDITDNGIYVEADGDSSMIGKYTVTLAARTKDVSGRIPEVKIQFTVNKSVSDLSFTGPNLIYKAANKKATAKTAVSAVSYYLNSVTNYNAMSAIKNPKVIYEVGTLDYHGEITPVDGITVDKKGVITIAKDFEVTNTPYTVRVSANEYLGQKVANAYTFKIKTEAVKVKALEAYLYNESEYTKITSKTSVPYDSLTSLRFAVKGTDGSYIIGGDGTEKNPVEIETIGNGNYGSLGLKIDSSISNEALGALTKPTNIAFTLSSLDGSKAKCAFKIGYAASSDNYDRLQIGQVNMMFGGSKTTIPETGEGAFTYDIPAEWGYNPIIELALSNGSTGPYSQAFGTPCISGSLSVQGAKIIVDYQNMAKAEAQMMGIQDIPCAKNQDIFIQPTRPVVKVTLTKPVYGTDGKMKTIKKQYTINCAASEAPKAPKIKSTMLGVPTGVEGQYTYEKMSRGRKYSENEVIEFRLDKPLVLPDDITPDQVYISFNTVVDMSSAGIPIKAYPIIYEMDLDEAGYFVDSDGNACVRMKCSDMVASYLVFPKMNVSLQYAYLDTVNDNKPIYITSTPSQGTVVFNPYKKSFKADATQTLKYIPGDTPVVVGDYITGKGTNVASVAVKKVYSCNVKGSYNDFATVFKVDSGKLAVDSSAYEKLKAEAAIVKNKGVPEARVGYVLCIVTYTDGTTDEVLSKVTVKFSK